jgi:L-fuculose-phosphate aldolase
MIRSESSVISEAQRQAVVDYCRRMVADGLVVGTSGNVSVRVGDRIAVSPTGMPYEAMTAEDVCVVDATGAVVGGVRKPTSELPMHLTAYAVTGANAVVHTHSTAATAVSTLVDRLPNIHYTVARFGGPIRVAPYSTYGTAELAAAMAAALEDRTGCLLQNHGTITAGATLEEAYANAQYLEWLCDVWLRASSAGTPKLLDDEEIERVRVKLKSYGQAESTHRPE